MRCHTSFVNERQQKRVVKSAQDAPRRRRRLHSSFPAVRRTVACRPVRRSVGRAHRDAVSRSRRRRAALRHRQPEADRRRARRSAVDSERRGGQCQHPQECGVPARHARTPRTDGEPARNRRQSAGLRRAEGARHDPHAAALRALRRTAGQSARLEADRSVGTDSARRPDRRRRQAAADARRMRSTRPTGASTRALRPTTSRRSSRCAPRSTPSRRPVSSRRRTSA